MIIKNLIYILQSEYYLVPRFLKFCYFNLKWLNLQKRKKINWTSKAKLIFILSVFLISIILVTSIYHLGIYSLWNILILFIILIILPFIISLSLFVVTPLDSFLKKKIKRRAKNILKELNIVVIGITGSYGKTSTKEILSTLLEEKFNTIKTPDNINTDIGISNYIINNKDKLKSKDILIVEMGAHRRGEILEICNIVNPDYSILTGIGESHLERFKTIDNTIKTKFELPENTKKISFLNFNDENIKENYKNFKIKKFVKVTREEVSSIQLKNDFLGLSFIYKENCFDTKLLAEHNIDLILLGIKLCLELGLSFDEIKEQVKKIEYIKHRLELIYNKNNKITVIDDSYNGNFKGIISGIEVLKRAKARKVVLTPGLVELGEKSKNIHNKIGSIYATNVDLVLVIKNSVSDYIVEGMIDNNFNNYKVYENTLEAHGDLKNILKEKDTIIFQNDWSDNYL